MPHLAKWQRQLIIFHKLNEVEEVRRGRIKKNRSKDLKEDLEARKKATIEKFKKYIVREEKANRG